MFRKYVEERENCVRATSSARISVTQSYSEDTAVAIRRWMLSGALFWLTIDRTTGNLDAQIWDAKPEEETWDAQLCILKLDAAIRKQLPIFTRNFLTGKWRRWVRPR